MPDFDIKEKLTAIKNCKDLKTFSMLASDFPERFNLGYLVLNPSFEQREDLIKKISHHCIISSAMEEIEQFKKGLSSNGILQILQSYPQESLALFTYDETLLTAEKFKSMFSYESSKTKEKAELEEDVLFNWNNFIDEVGNKNVKYVAFSLEDVENGVVDESKKKERTLVLSDILMFLTGSRYSFHQKIRLCFDHLAQGRVLVSTCTLEITFPMLERYTSSTFSDNIIQDIVNSPGFGFV